MIADQERGRPDQLDIAAAEQAAPEQQKCRDEQRGGRRECVEAGARVALDRDAKGGEREDRDDHLVRNATGSDVTISHNGEDTDSEEKND